MTLRFTHADGLVYRVGYSPDPWAWVPWEYSPFTGRWDDPEALFRTIYAASSAEACYIEILAQFRPDPGLDPDLASIAGCPDDAGYEGSPPGVVGRSWLRERRLGSAHVTGRFVDSRRVSPSGPGTVTTCGSGRSSNETPTSAGTAVIFCGTAAMSR